MYHSSYNHLSWRLTGSQVHHINYNRDKIWKKRTFPLVPPHHDWFSPFINFDSSSMQEYQGSSVLGQFVTRFLLRETSTQLQSLQSSLDCAMEAVHDQGKGRRILKKPEDLPIQRVSKRPGRRIQKNMCLSPTDPYSGMLTTGMFSGNIGGQILEVNLIRANVWHSTGNV